MLKSSENHLSEEKELIVMNFDLIWDGNVLLAETPIWDPKCGRLIWTDMYKGDVHETDFFNKKDRVWNTGSMIGSAIPCSDEELLLVVIAEGVFLLDKRDGSLEPIVNPEPGRPENFYNDSRVDAAGRIFTSTVAKMYGTDDYRDDMVGAFYMIDTDRTVHTLATSVNQYNCITWNSDDTKMFVVDAHNALLLSFDYDIGSGPVGESKIAMDFTDFGTPDGVSIDIEDNLYICHWSGKITVWDKNISLKEVWDFPVPQVCCGGFGGIDRKDFYVATARYAYTPEQLENRNGAGGIFVGRTDIAGAEEHFFQT